MTRKRRTTIGPGERVNVTFSERERSLVIDHTFADAELSEPLESASLERGRYSVRYTLDDIDELAGFVAAQANHTKKKRLQKELYALHERLHGEMESYDDGLWQDSQAPPSDVAREPKVRRTQLRVIAGGKVKRKG